MYATTINEKNKPCTERLQGEVYGMLWMEEGGRGKEYLYYNFKK